MIEHGMDMAQRIIWQWGMPIALGAVTLLLIIKLARWAPRLVLFFAAILIAGVVAALILTDKQKGNDDPFAHLPEMERELAIALTPFTPAPVAPKPIQLPPPTNALCGRCGGTFWASWAPTCRCPRCGFLMNARQAKREHGPEYYPL